MNPQESSSEVKNMNQPYREKPSSESSQDIQPIPQPMAGPSTQENSSRPRKIVKIDNHDRSFCSKENIWKNSLEDLKRQQV